MKEERERRNSMMYRGREGEREGQTKRKKESVRVKWTDRQTEKEGWSVKD